MIAESFKTAALDEMTHILYFSDLITKCGGNPTFTEWKIDQSNELKKMLTADVQLEREAKERYESQIERFKSYPELVALIKNVLFDESEHEELFTSYLNENK